MARITWGKKQDIFYETGVQRGVFYGYNPVSKKYDDYAAWNGLSKVTESPDGGDESAIYADNQKYLSLTSAEDLKGTIEAYTYPKKFKSYDGTAGFQGVQIGQQARKKFGMVYTTLIGDSDAEASIDNNYLIHVIYGIKVSPSEREYGTINDNPDAITFSWKFTTTPESIGGSNLKPTASLVFDTRYMSAASIKKIEDTLYGSATDATKPMLPSPDELISIAQSNLLIGALGYSDDRNNITTNGQWFNNGSINGSFLDEFNKHIRDYDGKRLLASCDLDLTFKEVSIPSSVSSFNVYCDTLSDNQGTGNPITISAVPEANMQYTPVELLKMAKPGETCTVHLTCEFTMNPKILKLNTIRTMLNSDPGSDEFKLVFDSHFYNVKLEVKHDNTNTETPA